MIETIAAFLFVGVLVAGAVWCKHLGNTKRPAVAILGAILVAVLCMLALAAGI